MSDKIITGERLQEMCAVYIGEQDDFIWNPRILQQTSKHMRLSSVPESWNNPALLFCYGHRMYEFRKVLPRLQNEFILVTHNSDQDIKEEFIDILENPKLRFWHAQNVLINHPKLGGIPIGIANSMWGHGDVTAVGRVIATPISKTKDFYFYFSVGTNAAARSLCKNTLENKGLRFDSGAPNFESYLRHLASHKYAICPPGNGIDSHRIWEVMYLGVIPICLRSVFTEKVNRRFPIILLDSWDNFDAEGLLKTYTPPTYSLPITEVNLREPVDYLRA
jgi:hypothetical protein